MFNNSDLWPISISTTKFVLNVKLKNYFLQRNGWKLWCQVACVLQMDSDLYGTHLAGKSASPREEIRPHDGRLRQTCLRVWWRHRSDIPQRTALVSWNISYASVMHLDLSVCLKNYCSDWQDFYKEVFCPWLGPPVSWPGSGSRLKNLFKDSSSLGDRTTYAINLRHDVKCVLWWKHVLRRHMCASTKEGLSFLIDLFPFYGLCLPSCLVFSCLLLCKPSDVGLTANGHITQRRRVSSSKTGGANDGLHIYCLCWIAWYPWHRRQIESPMVFSASSERHWQSGVNEIAKFWNGACDIQTLNLPICLPSVAVSIHLPATMSLTPLLHFVERCVTKFRKSRPYYWRPGFYF